MLRPAALLVTVVAVLGADVYLFGTWTGRWAPSHDLERAVERLPQVPREVGDWRGEDVELGAREIERAEIAGYVYRRYRHARTGDEYTVLLLCGRSGPMSVHTPDVCYRGAGFKQAADAVAAEVPRLGSEDAANLWTAEFGKEGSQVGRRLQIYWGWCLPGGEWQAPANPRVAFAGKPAVYKLYVVRSLTSANRKAEEAQAQEFLRALLGQLDPALRPAPAEQGATH